MFRIWVLVNFTPLDCVLASLGNGVVGILRFETYGTDQVKTSVLITEWKGNLRLQNRHLNYYVTGNPVLDLRVGEPIGEILLQTAARRRSSGFAD